MFLLAICMSSLGNYLFRPSACFLIELLGFDDLVLSCMSCLHILHIIDLLSDISFANIFSCAIGCLLVLFEGTFSCAKTFRFN